MNRISGLQLLEERERARTPAKKGDRVVCNARLFLNHGDEVPLYSIQAKQLPKEMVRVEKVITFVDHTIVLGRCHAIAGVEHALTGMKAGGYRKVRVSPHLVSGNKGIPNLIPFQCGAHS
jgi:FKBP-type peptidyl-prolyl cis-trans isomerase (trigger factor)